MGQRKRREGGDGRLGQGRGLLVWDGKGKERAEWMGRERQKKGENGREDDREKLGWKGWNGCQ